MMLMSDIQIREAVLRAIKWDPCISVAVFDGTVTLSGTVDSTKHSLEAHQSAKIADGVFKVIDEIKVASVDPSEAIKEKVRGAIEAALKRRAELEASRIRVSLNDGLVTLSGPVQSREEELAIVNAASRAPGVRKVNDRLNLEC